MLDVPRLLGRGHSRDETIPSPVLEAVAIARPTETVPTYHLTHVDEDGVKWYNLRCIFCGHVDTRGLPAGNPTGFYFSFPLRCINCDRSARYYYSSKPAPEARPSEGTGTPTESA